MKSEKHAILATAVVLTIILRMKKSFTDDFEGTTRLADLLDRKRGWTAIALQSPKAPTVKDYVKLRQRILKGESDFLDNRINPSGEVVHGGKTALKTVSMPANETPNNATATQRRRGIRVARAYPPSV
jgi:hypothetical protein